jgi:hypothetical protein
LNSTRQPVANDPTIEAGTARRLDGGQRVGEVEPAPPTADAGAVHGMIVLC